MAVKGLEEDSNGFSFYWKIKHFSLCLLLEKCYIETPVIQVEEMDNTKWCLYLYPGEEESVAIFGVARHVEDEGPEVIPVDTKVFLLKTNGDKVIEVDDNLPFKLEGFLQLEQERSAIFDEESLFLLDDTLTAGCFMKKPSLDSDTSSFVEYTACTEISTEKCSFVLPINISQQQPITVSKVSLSEKYPHFKIILEPSNSACSFMAVKIVISQSNTVVLCKCKLSVKDTKNTTVFLYRGTHKYLANADDQSWILPNSLTSVDMTDFTKDSTLILRCVLVVSDGTHSSHIENITYPISAFRDEQSDLLTVVSKQSHLQKLKCLLEDKRLCDFTLQVDGKEFRIHKAVLGAVSPVFCAMFEREMKERENSVSVIEDIEADIMQKLIHFAYTEIVENLEWESAIKLYNAANKYLISELKQCCSNWITANLTIENVTQVLTISDMYEDKHLEKTAADFVFAHAKEIFRSENWNMFIGSNATVAAKIMQEICIKLTSSHISEDLKF